MCAGTALGQYLRARRELVRPEAVGLRGGSGRRRVPGLRREELATLAGISAEHVGARADLKAVAANISQQLRLLDKVVRYRFGDDADLMAAWESARNVAGPFKSKNEPQSEAGGSETKAA